MYYLKKPTRWSKGIGAALPEAYKKFWKEWHAQPSAVHYIEEKGKYKLNEETEEVYVIKIITSQILFNNLSVINLFYVSYILQSC